MAIIVKNTTTTMENWGGMDIAPLSSYTVQVVDVDRFVMDEDFKLALISGTAVINDGTTDLNAVDGVLWMQGYKPNTLKIIGEDGSEAAVVNGRLQIEISGGTQYIRADGTVPFTGDQSLGGNALTNVSTVNGVVIQSHKSRHESGGDDAIDHNNLTGLVSNEHINHEDISISTGYGLSGGGDITTSRTLVVGLDSKVNAINNTTVQTTSTNMNSTGLVVTLTPGIWFVSYSSVLSATSNGRLITTELYINGAAIPATESQYRVGSGGGLLGGLLRTSVDQGPTMASTIIEVTGNHVLELRWRTSGGTAVMQQRQITAIRIA